jgi:hypothetical protein
MLSAADTEINAGVPFFGRSSFLSELKGMSVWFVRV